MDYLEKPPIIIPKLLFKCVMIPLLLLVAAILTGVSVKYARNYETVKANPLVLDVAVTHVDVDYDADNGDDYHAMVEYVYNGVKYIGKYKTFSTEKKAQNLVGKQVTIYVDPQNPGEQLGEIRSDGNVLLIIACVMVFLAGLCFRIRHRPSCVDTYGWRREAIRKDIIYKYANSASEEMIAAVFLFYAVAATHPSTYLRFSIGHVFGLVFLLVGLMKLLHKLKNLKKAKNREIVLRQATVVSREIIPDSEGPDTYKITYKSDSGLWTQNVSQKVYDQASVGNIIEAAYLEGDRIPCLSRTTHGDVF